MNSRRHNIWHRLIRAMWFTMLFVLASPLFAQEYTFRHYGINDGLPILRINCCMQDKRGFMWFGTDQGLACFDGVRFRTNIPFKANNYELQGTIVSRIMQDADGLLWIATTKGLYTYDIDEDCLQHVKPKGWDICGATSLDQDAEGAIWAITANAFYRLDFHRASYHRFTFQDNFLPTSLVTSRSGMTWMLAVDGCIYLFQPTNGTFTPYRITAEDADDRARILLKGIEREDGKIIITTNMGGAHLFSPTTKSVETLFTTYGDEPPVITHAMMKRSENEYWFGTEKGVYVWTVDDTHAGMVHLQKDHADSHSLSDNAVHDLCRDKEGGVWIATSFGGVNYMASDNSAFHHIELSDAQHHVECNVVRSIIPDRNGALWIGAEDGGLYHYDPQTGTIRSLSHLTWQGRALPPNIQSLLLLGNELWIGNFDGSIYVYDIEADKITKRHVLPGSFPVDMLATKDGHIYVATSISLLECSRDDSSASCRFTPTPGAPSGFMHHLCEDHEGNIWLATLGQGVWCRKAKKTANKAWERKDFPVDYTCSVFEDSRGVIWVGSVHNGLYTYDATTGKGKAVENTLHQAGLGIYRIVEDNRGVLWITSSNGLYSYDRTSENVMRYGLSPMLNSPQFNFNSGYIDNTGRIYFGSLDGIVSFAPEMVDQPEADLTVYFTDYINEGTSFGVCFSVPVFSIQETLWFRYRLKGVDKDWTVVQGQRNIRYINLDYGQYTLEVESSLQNGNWTGKLSTLSIDIVAPWYATTLAKWICALCLILACLIIYKRYRLRRQEKKRTEEERRRIEQEKELSHEKVKFFTAITHEIRTPLTLIMTPVKSLIDAFSAEKAQLMLPTIYRNANELLNLVNQILDYRKLEQGRARLELSHGDMSDFCRTVMDLFGELARKKHIDFTADVNSPLYMNFDKEKMRCILTNLLGNAFKFTPDNGCIRLGLKVVGRQCEISVSDNGVGISPKDLPHIFDLFYQSEEKEETGQESLNTAGSGIGLHLVREFTRMHSGQVNVESSRGGEGEGPSGTIFTVVLPTDLSMAGDNEAACQRDDKTANQQDDDMTGQQDNEVAELPDNEEDVPHNAKRKPTILLVDDNEELRQYLHIELSGEYKILQATNGQEALTTAQEQEVDIVVSDVMMPVMDGIELCHRLKDNVQTSHLFVILLTAKVGEPHRLSGYKAGADYYIFKPFNIELLRNRIDYLYKLRQQRHDMFLHDNEITPSELTNSRLDEDLYNKAVQLVNQNISNEAYSVEQFSSDMCMSRITLYRKLEHITGQKPLEFIRAIRLKKAATMLKSTDRSIQEIAEMVGFGTPRNFSKNFKTQYGVSPSEYKKNKE